MVIEYKYEDKDNPERTKLIKDNIETLKKVLPQSPFPQLIEGIFAVNNNDISEAKRLIGIAKSKSKNDASAYLSMAFLYFISGKFQNGYQEYKLAFKKTIGTNTLFQTLDFIEKYLAEYSDRIELHFVLGLINIELMDETIGLDEMKKFLEKAKNGKYKFLIKKAKKYITNR